MKNAEDLSVGIYAELKNPTKRRRQQTNLAALLINSLLMTTDKRTREERSRKRKQKTNNNKTTRPAIQRVSTTPTLHQHEHHQHSDPSHRLRSMLPMAHSLYDPNSLQSSRRNRTEPNETKIKIQSLISHHSMPTYGCITAS